MSEFTITLELGVAEQELVREFSAASSTLVQEQRSIVDAVAVISAVAQGDPIVGLAPSVIASAEYPDMPVHDLGPYILKVVGPYTKAEQLDTEQPQGVRHTMNWQGLKTRLDEALASNPGQEELIADWFARHGELTRMNPDIGGSHKPIINVLGAANDQCRMRNVLALITLAAPEFVEEHGLHSNDSASLQGEDSRGEGWMKLGGDDEMIAALRTHVRERIQAGNIDPRIVVTASSRLLKSRAAEGKKGELENVTPHLEAAGYGQSLYGTEELTGSRIVTEGDAFLAGALTIYGGKAETIEIQDIAAASEGERNTKLITFDSEVGKITVLVNAEGTSAKVGESLKHLHSIRPEIFNNCDGVFGTTTAIYVQTHRTMLRMAIAELGLDIPTDTFGISAHAAGLKRNIVTLLAETRNYLQKAADISERAADRAHAFTSYAASVLLAQGQ